MVRRDLRERIRCKRVLDFFFAHLEETTGLEAYLLVNFPLKS